MKFHFFFKNFAGCKVEKDDPQGNWQVQMLLEQESWPRNA